MTSKTKAKETKADEPEEAASEGVTSEDEPSPVWRHRIENDWVLNRLGDAEIATRLQNAGLSAKSVEQ